MIQAFLKKKKKQEKSQVNNLSCHLNKPEKEEGTKPKLSRRKEIIEIRDEINKIEMKKQQKRSMKSIVDFLKRQTRLINL